MSEREPSILDTALNRVKRVGEVAGSVVAGLFEGHDQHAVKIHQEDERLRAYQSNVVNDLRERMGPLDHPEEIEKAKQRHPGYL